MVTKIYDGNKLDSTNFTSLQYLKINSCGVQTTALNIDVTVREAGRQDYTLIIVEKGSCKASYGKQEYLLSAGDIIIYPPHARQKYSFHPNSVSFWCHFTGSSVENILASYSVSTGVCDRALSQAATEAFLTLLRRYNSGASGLCNAAFLELLFHLSDTDKNLSVLPHSIAKVLDYININYQKPISLDDLAQISGYSKSRFSHLFSEYTKSSPIRYINDLRFENARDMLRSTSLSIREVASLCGFEDQLYFCKLFRRKYGISPSEYRKTK